MEKPPLTFARFVQLSENSSAWLAVRELAEQLVSTVCSHPSCNPLLLHGPPGTGKTHLVSGLAEEVTQQRPETVVVHLSAGDFAIRDSGVDETIDPGDEVFTRARQNDLLIVEDLQHLPAAATLPFARLIDRLQARRQQMLFTADAGPRQLHNRHGRLPARLISRLAGGMVVRLDSPRVESRRLLLQKMSEHLSVSDAVIVWLADHLTEGGRQLVGAVKQLEMLTKMHGSVDAKMVAAQFQPHADASAVTVEKIAQRVGSFFQVKPNQLASKQRQRHLLLARQVSMYLARRLTDLSLVQIGAYFGGRDHTTVMHACRKVEKNLKTDAALAGALRELQTDLG